MPKKKAKRPPRLRIGPKPGTPEYNREAQRKWRAKATKEDRIKGSEARIELHRSLRNKFSDVGEIPERKDPQRYERGRDDLEFFLRTYLSESFPKPFSNAHKKVIEHLQLAATKGGKFLDIVFREFGKTSLAEGAVIYTASYGLRKFIVFIGATGEASRELIDSIRTEWNRDGPLHKDFPEIAKPLEQSQGIAQRCNYQTYNNHLTGMVWTGDELVFPWIDGYPPAGVIIASKSILGRLHGLKRKAFDGTQVRPDFVLIDDPQDIESAESPTGVAKRLKVITRVVLNLSGTKRPISIAVASTILAKNDVIDQLSNQKMHGTWMHMKIPFVEKWAEKKAHEIWLGPYRDMLLKFDPEKPGDDKRAYKEAVQFYLKNRATMDAGASMTWEHGYADHEVSSIQHAYNKLIELGQEDFDCEFQGKPPEPVAIIGQVELVELHARLNRRERGTIPQGAEHLTAFIDVQAQSLYWIVAAWKGDFTGYVIDYGIYPEQPSKYFTAHEIKITLEKIYPAVGQEGRWNAAFREIVGKILGRPWKREDGVEMRVDRLAIDANDGHAYDTVCEFCKSTEWPNVMPYRSRGVGAAGKPFSEYHRNPGDKIGLNWRIPAVHGKRTVRIFTVDVNFWKTFIKNRWRTPLGDHGALTIFGIDPAEHRLFFDQMMSERGIETHGQGRRLEEWRFRNPSWQENHWLDGLVGAAALASFCGCSLGIGEATTNEKTRRTFGAVSADELAALGGK